MKLKKILLIHLIFFIVILDFLAGNIRDIRKELNHFYNQNVENEETHYINRFEKLKDKLPGQSILGYFTNKEYSTNDAARFFFLTQYALSPLIIVRNTKPTIIIADVSDSFNIIEFSNKYNCSLLRNFGDGILLFQKRTE